MSPLIICGNLAKDVGILRLSCKEGKNRQMCHCHTAWPQGADAVIEQGVPVCGQLITIGLQAVVRRTIPQDHTRFARFTPRLRLPTADTVLDQISLCKGLPVTTTVAIRTV